MAYHENNLSQGNVLKQLIRFSMPVLLSNLIQSLYGVTDMIIVGRFAGTVSMSGVNIGGQVTFLMTNMVFGLCVGATVLIGQYLGAGDKKAIRETIGTLFTVILGLSAFFTVLATALRVPLLRLIQTPPESFSETNNYFTITILGTVFIFMYNALSAVMRGLGDSKNPLIFVSIACAVNVVLDYIAVAVWHTGAGGAAAATVISQALSVLLCILYLRRKGFIFEFKWANLRVQADRLRMLLSIGIPSSIQNTATSASFLFLTTLVNTLGVTASAAVGAVGKFNMFAILPALAMSAAVSAMSAHNIGAGEHRRALQTAGIGMAIAALISFTLFFIARLYPAPILRIFADDAEMVEKGIVYMRSFTVDYLIVPFVFCLNGLFTGAGHTRVSLVIGILASLAIRIPVSYLFGMHMGLGLFGVGLGAPFASGTALLLCVAYLLTGKWKTSSIVHLAPLEQNV